MNAEEPDRFAFRVESTPGVAPSRPVVIGSLAVVPIPGHPRELVVRVDSDSPEALERARAAIAQAFDSLSRPAPEWTKTPPTEEGYYIVKVCEGREAEPVRLKGVEFDGGFVDVINWEDAMPARDVHLWWPVKLEMPK